MERRHAADEKAGVNYVSINIFSWARLQPDEETYDFSTLDKIMDMLAENGIGAPGHCNCGTAGMAVAEISRFASG